MGGLTIVSIGSRLRQPFVAIAFWACSNPLCFASRVSRNPRNLGLKATTSRQHSSPALPAPSRPSHTFINPIPTCPDRISTSLTPIRPSLRQRIHPQNRQSRRLQLIAHIAMPDLMAPRIHTRRILMNRVHPRQIRDYPRHLMDMQLSKIRPKINLLMHIQVLISQEDDAALGD